MEIKLSEENFEKEVLKSEIPVLVDFWASWCGPCKMLSPVIEEIAKDFDGKIKVGKVNVDDELGLAMKYRVEVIPTLILFVDGKEEKSTVGFYEKKDIIANFSLDKEMKRSV